MSYAGSPVVLSISDASDGTGNKPTDDKFLTRNDNYYLEKIAERWIKDRGQIRPGTAYRLSSLPSGYAGFEKQRESTNHIDRFLYGHPSGRHFRSMNELYPHFKHLQDYGSSSGCLCVLCAGGKKAFRDTLGSVAKSDISGTFNPSIVSSKVVDLQQTSAASVGGLPQGRLQSPSPSDQMLKSTSYSPNIYSTLLTDLKSAHPEDLTDITISDHFSPDWRAGSELLETELEGWRRWPAYFPRVGEVVLFLRAKSQSRWEAGVVSQMPDQSVLEQNELECRYSPPPDQQKSIAYSGIGVEPLSEPGRDVIGPFELATRHKYVPVCDIRPMIFWQNHTSSVEEMHPTIRHALTITNSFAIVGRYRFHGAWPDATLFARGLYLGSEFIMVGDTVRLLPSCTSEVTDVMVITSIRLRFIDLDESVGPCVGNCYPHPTCLHIIGRVFTLDSTRSYSGTASSRATPGQDRLPMGLAGYGAWYHVLNPSNPKERLRIPYHRVIGRCFEAKAIKDWSEATSVPSLSHGIAAIQQARDFSSRHNKRIDRDAGKTWFWAESRIEQLDLHELNGRLVGAKDESRSVRQMNAWSRAIRVMEEKQGRFDDRRIADSQRKAEEAQQLQTPRISSSAGGLLAASATADSVTEDEDRGTFSATDSDDSNSVEFVT